jgi:hypothetical protein
MQEAQVCAGTGWLVTSWLLLFLLSKRENSSYPLRRTGSVSYDGSLLLPPASQCLVKLNEC